MTVEVRPGDTLTFDPGAEKSVLFDFDRLNLAPAAILSGFAITITPIKQNGATALTFDSSTLTVDLRKVVARFLATTASPGDEYEVECKGITNETPTQKKPYAIHIRIEN